MTKFHHAIIDYSSGTPRVRGSDGRDHTLAELEAAERLAAAGDHDAKALLATFEVEVEADSEDDILEVLEQQLHDCPECRAAMARGEKPTFGFSPGVIPRAVRRRMKALARKHKN